MGRPRKMTDPAEVEDFCARLAETQNLKRVASEFGCSLPTARRTAYDAGMRRVWVLPVRTDSGQWPDASPFTEPAGPA